MKFCTNCGEKSSSEAIFCKSCGSSFQETSTVSQVKNEQYFENSSRPEVLPAKKMSKKQKYIFTIAGVIGVLVVIVHLVLSNMYDPMKKIQAMNTAYNNQDKEAFFEEFYVKKGTIAKADNFYTTVKEYGWSNLREELTYEVEQLTEKKISNVIFNQDGEFISVISKPVLFGLYEDVVFSIIPIEVFVNTPYKDMTLTIEDKEFITKNNDEKMSVGKFIAGEYEWAYNYEGPYIPLSNKGDLSISGNSDNEVVIDLDWNMSTYNIVSNVDNAIVYIDGKSTKQTVDELSELYPVQYSEKHEIYAQTTDKNNKEVKSVVQSFSDNSLIELSFDFVYEEERHAQAEEDVKRVYKSFRSDYVRAIDYIDFDYIDQYFREGSQIKKDYAKFVVDHDKIAEFRYDFLLNDVTSFKSIAENKYELETFETFNYSSEADGNLNYERKKKYTITFVDGEYYIDAIVDLDTKKQKY